MWHVDIDLPFVVWMLLLVVVGVFNLWLRDKWCRLKLAKQSGSTKAQWVRHSATFTADLYVILLLGLNLVAANMGIVFITAGLTIAWLFVHFVIYVAAQPDVPTQTP